MSQDSLKGTTTSFFVCPDESAEAYQEKIKILNKQLDIAIEALENISSFDNGLASFMGTKGSKIIYRGPEASIAFDALKKIKGEG